MTINHRVHRLTCKPAVLSKTWLFSCLLFLSVSMNSCRVEGAFNAREISQIKSLAASSSIEHSSAAVAKCKERAIEQNVENADVIFVGTVRKIDRNYSHHIYDAFVQIHRIIKGHPQIYELVSSNYEYAKYISDNERSLTSSEALLFRNVTKRAATKFTVNGHVVTITNFGNKQICDSHVTPNDIRVFMLTLESNPHQQQHHHHQYYAKRLVLNSSVIHTRLNSLTNLNSFIESENFEDVKSESGKRAVFEVCRAGWHPVKFC